MAADSQWEVQKDVFELLRDDATLQSLCGDGASPVKTNVHDRVPQDEGFPYIQIGETTALDWDTKSTDGMEQTITVHTFSRYSGNKEIKEIMGAIVDALDDASMTLSGHSLILIQFEFSETFMDQDGRTHHGVQRFRVVTQGD